MSLFNSVCDYAEQLLHDISYYGVNKVSVACDTTDNVVGANYPPTVVVDKLSTRLLAKSLDNLVEEEKVDANAPAKSPEVTIILTPDEFNELKMLRSFVIAHAKANSIEVK